MLRTAGPFLLYSTRQKIEREVRKIAHEHLVVFVDDQRTRQVWQWASRVSGGPSVYREHEYHSSQNPLGMLQRLEPITFVLDDEDGLTLLRRHTSTEVRLRQGSGHQALL